MHNRVILLTGASSGIGAATAKLLGETSRLALVARRADKLAELAARISDTGGQAIAIPADLTDPVACAAVVEQTVGELGGLDVLINNAGIFGVGEHAAIDQAHIDDQLALNLRAPMLLAHHAIPHLARDNGGWIVNVSSVAAEQTFAGCGLYSATKAALETWSRVLREELRTQGIRVSVVAPGATDTAVFDGSDFDRSKMARVEDVARAIAFVISAAPTANIDRLVVTPPGGAL